MAVKAGQFIGIMILVCLGLFLVFVSLTSGATVTLPWWLVLVAGLVLGANGFARGMRSI